MVENPFFTIGVPVYNAEKYIGMCIDSILNQSFRNFELILVNDGSKDGSLKICNAYQQKDSRVIVIDQPNGGVSRASNRILDAARGEYVFLMDNDDEMYEGMLEKAWRELANHPVDIQIGNYYAICGEKKLLRLFRNPEIIDGFKNRNEYLRYEYEVGFPTSLWSKIVRNHFWKESGVRFNPEYDGVQDADVSCRLMEKSHQLLSRTAELLSRTASMKLRFLP